MLKWFLGVEVYRLLSSTIGASSRTFQCGVVGLDDFVFSSYGQQETPPGASMLSLTGATLTPSRMVMLLRYWALWPSWQTGRTLSRVATISAREMTVKCPNCMAILLTNGPWVGLEFHRCLHIQGYFAIGGTLTEPLPNGILPWHWCNPKRSSNIFTDITFLILCYWISSGDGITWLHGWALLPLPCYGVKWATNKVC